MINGAKKTYDIELLEAARIEQFLTYKDLATKANLPYFKVHRLLSNARNHVKRGTRNPYVVKELAIALDLPFDRIIIEEKISKEAA